MFISLQQELDNRFSDQKFSERKVPPQAFVQLWWGEPETGGHFTVAGLRAVDLSRHAVPRSAAADLDWRVSRALVAAACAAAPAPAAAPVIGLSHKRGHAVVLAAPPGSLAGVDLEAMRPRNFAALCQWVATPEEAAAVLAAVPAERARRFYALWTVKEALLKALNLNFPADMRRVGWDGQGHRGGLRAPAGNWRGLSMVLDGRWMVTAVWAAGASSADAAGVWWTAGPGAVLPPIEVVRRYG